MNPIDSYVYLLATYATLYSIAYLIYQRFKSRLTDSDAGETEV